MPTLVARNFEIVTPTLSVLDAEDLRMPEPGEVLLAHGITIENVRHVKLGSLAMPQKPPKFVGSFALWHYDYIHTQAHLTGKGKLKGRFAGINGELPSLAEVRDLSDELDEAALSIDISAEDLLVFGGGRSDLPIAHSVIAEEEPRLSYFLKVQI